VAGRYDGDDLVLSGRATAVQAAAAADWLLVTAATDRGGRLVLVERPRAAVEPRRTLDETRRWYDVVLDGVRIRAADVVAADESDIRWLADAAAVLSAADSLGVGERLLEMTVGHVKVREQFGRPLGSFQSVKHKVADMLTTLKGARAATYYAAMALDAGVAGASVAGAPVVDAPVVDATVVDAPVVDAPVVDATVAASVAKAFTAEGVAALAGEALQAHGGIGFTWEHDLHLYLRRAKVNEMLYGSPAEHYERLAALLDRGREGA
jgi:alkylation response protein AidB-like acyl-CoA dehydrogenase